MRHSESGTVYMLLGVRRGQLERRLSFDLNPKVKESNYKHELKRQKHTALKH